jgi:hypothetical protein
MDPTPSNPLPPFPPFQQDPEIPADLALRLRALYRPTPAAATLPPATDQAITRLIDLRAKAIARQRTIYRFLGRAAAVAAAAGLALAAVIIPRLGTGHPMQPLALSQAAASELPGDVNRDGVVDILDALVLARQLESREVALDATGILRTWDINHDGAIDAQDVEAIAHAAVRLENRG